VQNCINLAKRSNYGIVEILNLFSLRNPKRTKDLDNLAIKTNDINKEFIIKYLEGIQNDETKDVIVSFSDFACIIFSNVF